MTETKAALYMIGFTKLGMVSSTASYGAHAFKDRRIVGRVDLEDVDAIEVEWF